jgi:hypothetical protein
MIQIYGKRLAWYEFIKFTDTLSSKVCEILKKALKNEVLIFETLYINLK